ncbi:putative 26S proteasome regulatory subunit [Orbilia oligospora]|uniref:Probable 26S proteasome regulatory subunit p27 n=3 Tax=Orbilia oligospora TaxID=2813651 RepID=A0A6G1M280_ORBOL|nr:putative 26S proteasome regulatory subunit [Orbilia oligospora]KAF3213788.1 putative 26S proteasome regulatory subunit [Orbilia oligospora]KAF3214712.1 putative 26S proteasome regulatory subunit [Orbilia oligospora]KAF3241261.1 putative 26S proteasome regulatory subunit [Orbilia oligospora]
MGRPMEANIHNPSVGGQAANTSSTSASNGTSSRDRILALMKRKDALEAEISALSAVLDTHGANMQTPLTTFDGYPRDDIDVAQIRTTRARIIPLVNDVKALMIEIEKALHAHHAEPTGTSTSADSSSTSAAPPITAPQTETPVIEAVFAVVDQVSPSSPAEQAGVQVGDKVKRFGSVGALNHEKLAKVAAEVQQNENRTISVLVCRAIGDGEQDLELQLTPRRDWGGRGMLGCHLLPL